MNAQAVRITKSPVSRELNRIRGSIWIVCDLCCRLQEVCVGWSWLGWHCRLGFCSDCSWYGRALDCHERTITPCLFKSCLKQSQPAEEVLVPIFSLNEYETMFFSIFSVRKRVWQERQMPTTWGYYIEVHTLYQIGKMSDYKYVVMWNF